MILYITKSKAVAAEEISSQIKINFTLVIVSGLIRPYDLKVIYVHISPSSRYAINIISIV
jgi:hypothetical protein